MSHNGAQFPTGIDTMIKLLMADDHAIVRNGLRLFFAQSQEVGTVDEAISGEQMLDFLQHNRYDLLLLDMNMPDMSGVEMIAQARELRPETPVLVLSADDSPLSARKALQAGAVGYLTKNSEPAALLHAVKNVVAGGKSMDPLLAQRIAFEEITPQELPHHTLSQRELQVLKLLAQGNSVTEIATKLFISHKTVSTHKARLIEKMGFQSSAELVRYALTHHLID
jgi:DNA-binding NarL/FixJ family response regulator